MLRKQRESLTMGNGRACEPGYKNRGRLRARSSLRNRFRRQHAQTQQKTSMPASSLKQEILAKPTRLSPARLCPPSMGRLWRSWQTSTRSDPSIKIASIGARMRSLRSSGTAKMDMSFLSRRSALRRSRNSSAIAPPEANQT